MNRCLSILTAITLAGVGAGHGQTIQVQSGAHSGFSRLVFAYPEAETWNLDQSTDGAILSLTARGLSLDVSNVFRFIQRTRLQDVRSTSQTLELTLGCACEVEVFRHQNEYLVIDIKDPSPTPIEVAEPENTQEGASTPRPVSTAPRTPFSHLSALVAANQVEVLSAREKAFQEELNAGLARGLSQGLLKPRLETEPSLEVGQERPDSNSAELLASNPNEEPADQTPEDQIRVVSAIDVRSIDETYDQLPEICDLTLDLNAARFPDDENPRQTLRRLQQRLAKMEVLPQPEVAVIEAAEVYLSLGFGAEARSLLDNSMVEAPVMRAVSFIVDGDLLGPVSVFEEGYACQNQALLWALLSQQSIPHEREIDEVALVATVMTLPRHLRTAIGQRFLRLVRESGRETLAANLEVALGAATAGVTEPIGEQGTSGPNITQGPEAFHDIRQKLETAIMVGAAAPEAVRSQAAFLVEVIPRNEDRQPLMQALILSQVLADQISDALELVDRANESGMLNSEFWQRAALLALDELRPAQFAIVAQLALKNEPGLSSDIKARVLDRLALNGLSHGANAEGQQRLYAIATNAWDEVATLVADGEIDAARAHTLQSERVSEDDVDWLVRDLDRFQSSSIAGPRAAFAQSVLGRRNAPTPRDDMTNATNALSQSARTRRRIETLLFPEQD